jgi:predicted dehydrogenase
MKKLGVGIIGLGIGRAHASAFAAHRHCQLQVLCDFSVEKRAEAAAAFPDVRLTDDAQSVLADTTVDIVVVASHDDDHHRQVVAALEGGKHVLAEKPLCLHKAEASDIYAMLEKRPGLRLSSNLSLRTCPRFAVVRDRVRSGSMGRLYSIDGEYLWGRRHKLTDGWRKDMPFYSIIHGAAVHMIDLIMWIRGGRPVEVHAWGNRICTQGSDLRANDFAALAMRFDDGCIARVSANGGCVHPHFHALTVFGTDMTFRHVPAGAEWVMQTGGGAEVVPCAEAYPAREERPLLVDSFVEAIVAPGAPMLVGEADVFNVMSVCCAAEESMRTGRAVAVEYFD